jgi:glycosyltransferase involved in cell wall biosynthesis
MRIGYDGRFITARASGNGVFTRCLLESLTKLDGDNDYVAYLADADVMENRDNLAVRRMPRMHRNAYLRLLATFPIELSLRPVDVFHAFYSVPMWVRAKVVLTLVEFFWFTNPERLPLSGLLQKQFRMMTRYAIKKAEIVIVPTHYVRTNLLNYFDIPEDKVVVIPLGLNDYFLHGPSDEEREVVRAKYRLNGRYLLAVGDLHKRKNFGALIDVFNRLQRGAAKDSGLKLVIAGKPFGDDGAVMTQVAASKFNKDIVVTGYVSMEDLRVLYWDAHVFVLPSLDEGFALTALEAMACQTPLACSDRGSLTEVVGDAGLLFDPSNGEEMEDTVRRLLDDDLLRQKLVKNGQERIAHFSWDAIAQQILGVYGQVS